MASRYIALAPREPFSIFASIALLATAMEFSDRGYEPRGLGGGLPAGYLGRQIGRCDANAHPLPNSTKLLSSPIAVPGEVRFCPDGELPAVTQRLQANGPMSSYAVDKATATLSPLAGSAKNGYRERLLLSGTLGGRGAIPGERSRPTRRAVA